MVVYSLSRVSFSVDASISCRKIVQAYVARQRTINVLGWFSAFDGIADALSAGLNHEVDHFAQVVVKILLQLLLVGPRLFRTRNY
jgi:hypothetical protein